MLARAAAATDDGDLRARIAGSLAAVTIRQGDPAAAERMCRAALALPGLSPTTAAMLQGQLGLLALEQGDLDQAMAWLDKGIAGIGDEVEHRAPMLLNRSVAHAQAGRLPEARADLERAVPDYAATGNAVERAMAVHNAGYVALLEGDLVAALETMGEARDVLASASAVNAAICERDRAEVFRDAGLAKNAEQSLTRVTQVFAAHRMRQARGEAEFQLARSLLTHDPEEAAKVAAVAARRFRAIGSDGWALRADGLRLRALLAVTADAPRSARSAPDAGEVDEVVSALEARHLRAEASALRLSQELWLASHRGRSGPAPRRIRVSRDAPIQVRLLAHEVRAARAAAQGDGSGTRRHAAAGLDELAGWQAAFGSLDLATALIVHGKGLIFAGLQSAARSGRADVVFEWSERARHLSQQVVPLRPPPDARLAADLAALRQLRSESGADWLSQPRAAELSERVRRRQWAATRAAGTRERISLEALRDELPSGTAFVTYIFDGTDFTAVVVVDGAAHVVRLGGWAQVRPALARLRADLDVAASVRSGPLASVIQRTLDESLATLSSVLLGPVLGRIGDRRVVLTVPGILGGIPWAMFPAMVGRAFTIATSATEWVTDRSHATMPGTGFVVGPRVPRAGEEVARASSAWAEAHVLSGERATIDATTRLASGVGTLHIAAHGRHTVENPLFSGLELADGTLFGYDIDLMPEVPQTVVLSACEVGRSSVRWGEEAIGMTRIWLHAGSRCVIASPVVVADDDACELLAATHEGLARGDTPADALAAAAERTGVVAPFQAHGSGF
nr:CHAT domain-containing protein [Microbacterium ulmi]